MELVERLVCVALRMGSSWVRFNVRGDGAGMRVRSGGAGMRIRVLESHQMKLV